MSAKRLLTEQQVEYAIYAVQQQQQDAVLKLRRRRVEESMESMALLRKQHLQWQQSVMEMLDQIRPDYEEVASWSFLNKAQCAQVIALSQRPPEARAETVALREP